MACGSNVVCPRFHVDSLYSSPVTFGEDLLSKKFRFVEHGPPLQVEPFAKTKEDLQFYLDNVPDPAKQGLFPVNMWVTKMRIKHLGDQYPVWGSCCPGQISSAGFFLGIKEFLIAVRQDQELAKLAYQCATAVLHRRIDVNTYIR